MLPSLGSPKTTSFEAGKGHGVTFRVTKDSLEWALLYVSSHHSHNSCMWVFSYIPTSEMIWSRVIYILSLHLQFRSGSIFTKSGWFQGFPDWCLPLQTTEIKKKNKTPVSRRHLEKETCHFHPGPYSLRIASEPFWFGGFIIVSWSQWVQKSHESGKVSNTF